MRGLRSVWRHHRLPWLLVCVATAVGCASPVGVPSDFDARTATVVARPDVGDPVLPGASGKGSAAATGAAVGAGLGLVGGSLACLAAGPLAPLCFATVVPATTLTTAAGTAAASAILADPADIAAAKRDMLRDVLDGAATTSRLADLLAARLRPGEPLPQGGGVSAATAMAPPSWTVQVALLRVDTVGRGVDEPFELVALGSLRLVRRGAADAQTDRSFSVKSPMPLRLRDWQADHNAAVRRSLDEMLQMLARDMATWLAP